MQSIGDSFRYDSPKPQHDDKHPNPSDGQLDFNFTPNDLVRSLISSTPRHQNHNSKQGPSSKRKRRQDVQKLSALPEPFIITPQDLGGSVEITPAAILPRSYITLDWMNTDSEAKLFRGRIPELDLNDVVLIGKYGNSMQLAGIQMLGFPGGETYTIFRLSNSIKLKYVRSLANKLKREYTEDIRPLELKDSDVSESDGENWWQSAGLEEDILVNAFNNANVTPSADQLRIDTLLKATKNLVIKKPKIAPTFKASQSSTSSVQTYKDYTHEDALSQIAHQYYNLLYISKTSLQYFPKATLSRARVVFQTNAVSPVSRLDLLLFLENQLISVEDCDTKYREGLLDISKIRREGLVQNSSVSEEELESMISAPEYLRGDEIKYILKWLESTSNDDAPIRSIEQEWAHLQKRMKELRSRETELQIILLLEILAIKAKLTDDKINEYSKLKKSAERKRKKQDKELGKSTKREKKKRKVNPADLLDVLIDRLCIWHSIGADDETKPSQQDISKQKDEKDYLRHFCVEIVAAYYSSRIPSVCDDIVRKCTGKMLRAHNKDQATAIKQTKQSEGSSGQTKPDNSDKELGVLQSAVGVQKPPLLTRSLTAPVRTAYFEATEATLSASFNGETQDLSFEIAAQVSQEKEVMKTSFRAGITNTKKNIDRRVVEVPKHRSKKQKTCHSEDPQLKDAIKNISKPNRLAVAEEMVSASAQRMRISGRKPKKTIRNPLAANTVQVAATPRKNFRNTRVLERSADIPGPIIEEMDFIPSSGQVVPQSSIKPGKRRAPDMEEIEATPSKKPCLERPRMPLHQQDLHQLNFLPSSPLGVSSTPIPPKRSLSESFKVPQTTKPNIFMLGTPTNPFRASTNESTSLASGFMNSISETPTKPSISSKLRFLHADVEEEVITSSPLQRPKPGTPVNRRLVPRRLEDEFDDNGPSIYEQLGWD